MAGERGDEQRLAQQTFLRQLQGEVEHWRREGMVTVEQAQAILGRYRPPSEAYEATHRYGRLVVMLAVLGSVLVGLGVILFFASNWQGLSQYAKLALLLTVLIATYAAGYYLRYQPGAYPRVGMALVFLGTLLYGATVFLVGQAYHVRANDPTLVLLWSIGVFPMAYTIGSQTITSLGILTLLLWLGLWGGSQMEDHFGLVIAMYVPFGLLLYSIGALQSFVEPLRRHIAPFQLLGLTAALLSLLPLTIRDFFGDLFRDFGRDFGEDFAPLAMLLALSAVSAGVVIGLAYIRGALTWRSLLEGAGMLALLAVVAEATLVRSFHPDAYAILFNLVLFGAILGVIVGGFAARRGELVNIGLVFFTIYVVVRYFDFGWGLMDRSFFFILGGLLLLGGGLLLERTRRRLLEQMEAA